MVKSSTNKISPLHKYKITYNYRDFMFISMKTTLLDIINEPKVLNPICYNSEPPFLMTERHYKEKDKKIGKKNITRAYGC